MQANGPHLMHNVHGHGHPPSIVATLLRAARGFINTIGRIAGNIIVVINNNRNICLVVVCVVIFIALEVAGFGAAGPIAGSYAATWQASIGDVAAGSLFATLQSTAMGGVGTSTVQLSVAFIALLLGV